MKDYNIMQLKDLIGAEVVGNALIQGVAIDSRRVNPGDLFVALRGEKVDGHIFVKKAIEAGASAVMVERKLDFDIPQIIVQNTYESLHLFAKVYRSSLNTFFIGVTGSNGKTSIKDMLNSVLNQSYTAVATIGNQNTELGTYVNVFNVDEDTDYAIMECGLDKPDDVKFMANFLELDAAIISSLAPAHMYQFQSIQDIANEKMKILNPINNSDYVYYQGDFDEFDEYLKNQYHSFGFEERNDYVISDVVLKKDGIDFKLDGVSYSSNLLGKHQASNASAVILLARSLDISEDDIRKGLQSVQLTSLRTEVLSYKASRIILDAYKSNPSSLAYALDLMNVYSDKKKKVLVLSEMVELGNISDKAHREVMDRIMNEEYDRIFLLGEAFEFAKNYKNVEYVNSFDELNFSFSQILGDDALILIKGSRSYALERLLKEKVDVK